MQKRKAGWYFFKDYLSTFSNVASTELTIGRAIAIPQLGEVQSGTKLVGKGYPNTFQAGLHKLDREFSWDLFIANKNSSQGEKQARRVPILLR